MSIEQKLDNNSSENIITDKFVQEPTPVKIINKEDKLKDLLILVIGVIFSLFSGFGAFVELTSTISERTEIKESTISYILLALLLIFISFIIIKSLINSDFKQKLKKQVTSMNYFSFMPIFLAIMGVSMSIVLLLPNQGFDVLIGWLMGIPVLFVAGIMAISFYKAKKRNSLDKVLSMVTLIIIGLFILALLIAPAVEINRKNYYAKRGEIIKKENTPVCSNDFMESYKESLSVGNYSFCMDAFWEYKYTVDVPIDRNSDFIVEGCKINSEIINRDSCMSKMSSSFGNTVPYCEEQTNCYDKLYCYFRLNKINAYSLNTNINPDGSTCIAK